MSYATGLMNMLNLFRLRKQKKCIDLCLNPLCASFYLSVFFSLYHRLFGGVFEDGYRQFELYFRRLSN